MPDSLRSRLAGFLDILTNSVSSSLVNALPQELTLAIDVGNSRIKFGLFERPKARSFPNPDCLHFLAVPLTDSIPWDTLVTWAEPSQQVTALVAGANPVGREKLHSTWPTDRWERPRQIDNIGEFPMNLLVDFPERLGIDRQLNAIAARKTLWDLESAVIVDIGTATTVDWLNGGKHFEGGAILPGLELSAKALRLHTTTLPELTWQKFEGNTPSVIGKNTEAALHSGLFYGLLGAIRELIEQINRISPRNCIPKQYFTGGAASLFAPYFPEARLMPYLSLQGLTIVEGWQSEDDGESTE